MIPIAAHGSKGLPAWPTGRLRSTRSPAASPCRNAPLNRARLRLAVATSRISGLPESIVDHLLFDQDESRAGEALCGNIGVTLPMHRFMPIGDANRHVLAENFWMHRATEVPKRRRSPASGWLRVPCAFLKRMRTNTMLSGPSPQGVHT
jgi:hypothetical protein